MADHLVWMSQCGVVSAHTVSESEFPVGFTEECVLCEDDACIATVRLKVCTDLVEFADGELDESRAAAFIGHIDGCARCQADLIEALQLEARLTTLRNG